MFYKNNNIDYLTLKTFSSTWCETKPQEVADIILNIHNMTQKF